MAKRGKGIFLVYTDIPAQHEDEFNKWYNEEHLPELLAVPGILDAARYVAVKGGPKYLAAYELENVDVMQSDAFKNRPRTPWGERVSPSVIGQNLTRVVGEQIFPATIEMPEVHPLIAPLVYAVPVQLLAYHVAVLKGTDVDQPRNLAKSVTVE